MKPQVVRQLWRSLAVVLVAATAVGSLLMTNRQQTHRPAPMVSAGQRSQNALKVLGGLAVRPAASKNGYSRKKYSDGWAKIGMCTIRDKIMARDMTAVRYRSSVDCTVISGTLDDPYTGKVIHFVRGPNTSASVQIDHVVAVSDTWQTGAQHLSKNKREQLYNDPLELIAVDGPANEQKGDGDAAVWLPSNSDYVCRYVARQIAVKQKYHLWVTMAERAAMEKTLDTCPGQLLPVVGNDV